MSAPKPGGTNPAVVIGAVVSIVLFSISAVVYVTVAGYNPERVIGLLASIAAPTVVSLMALVQIGIVKTQTNGELSTIKDRLSSVESNTDPDTDYRQEGGAHRG